MDAECKSQSTNFIACITPEVKRHMLHKLGYVSRGTRNFYTI